MNITGKTRLVGVIGWPVEHSLSPPMQNAAIEALGLDWVYLAMPVHPDRLREAILGARAMGFIGLNATIPHKQALLNLVDEIDPTAEAIGAINTIHFLPDGHIRGFNTDALGYTRTVEEESDFSFAGATVLQIGVGGVGRAMAAGAAAAGAARVIFQARRPEKAAHLAADLTSYYPDTRFEALWASGELRAAAAQAELIANATPLGMEPDDAPPFPAELIQSHHTIFDTVYTPALTDFIAAARAAGAATVGGLGMLARQGAKSLNIWSADLVDHYPDEALMIRILQQRLGVD